VHTRFVSSGTGTRQIATPASPSFTIIATGRVLKIAVHGGLVHVNNGIARCQDVGARCSGNYILKAAFSSLVRLCMHTRGAGCANVRCPSAALRPNFALIFRVSPRTRRSLKVRALRAHDFSLTHDAFAADLLEDDDATVLEHELPEYDEGVRRRTRLTVPLVLICAPAGVQSGDAAVQLPVVRHKHIPRRGGRGLAPMRPAPASTRPANYDRHGAVACWRSATRGSVWRTRFEIRVQGAALTFASCLQAQYDPVPRQVGQADLFGTTGRVRLTIMGYGCNEGHPECDLWPLAEAHAQCIYVFSKNTAVVEELLWQYLTSV